MVAMNDLIVCFQKQWFLGLPISPKTRRITFFHLLVLVLLLPAVGALFVRPAGVMA